MVCCVKNGFGAIGNCDYPFFKCHHHHAGEYIVHHTLIILVDCVRHFIICVCLFDFFNARKSTHSSFFICLKEQTQTLIVKYRNQTPTKKTRLSNCNAQRACNQEFCIKLFLLAVAGFCCVNCCSCADNIPKIDSLLRNCWRSFYIYMNRLNKDLNSQHKLKSETLFSAEYTQTTNTDRLNWQTQ